MDKKPTDVFFITSSDSKNRKINEDSDCSAESPSVVPAA